MAQPGKRKPSLVWEFFEKLDDGSGISGGIFFFAVFLAVFFRYFWYFYNTGTVQKRRYLMFQIQNTGTALKLAIPLCIEMLLFMGHFLTPTSPVTLPFIELVPS